MHKTCRSNLCCWNFEPARSIPTGKKSDVYPKIHFRLSSPISYERKTLYVHFVKPRQFEDFIVLKKFCGSKIWNFWNKLVQLSKFLLLPLDSIKHKYLKQGSLENRFHFSSSLRLKRYANVQAVQTKTEYASKRFLLYAFGELV